MTNPGDNHLKMKVRATMHRRLSVAIIVLLTIISLAHLCRLVTGVELTIGQFVVPQWVSLLGFVGPAVLAGLFWWSRSDQ